MKSHHGLWVGERLLATWVAGLPWPPKWRTSLIGGTLLLTDQRLIFEPLKVVPFSKIVQVSNAVVALGAHYMALPEIDEVYAMGQLPARIQVDLINGQHRYYFVCAKRTSLSLSKSNLPIRDDAVKRINEAVKKAG